MRGTPKNALRFLGTPSRPVSGDACVAPTSRENPSNFSSNGALVPAPQQQVRDEREREENGDAADGEEKQRREHARNVEAVAGFDNAVGKSGAGAGRSCCNLR